MKTKALSVRNEAFLERTHACNSRVRISSIFAMSIRNDASLSRVRKPHPLPLLPPTGDEARHFWPSSTSPTRSSVNIFLDDRLNSPLPSRAHRSFFSSSSLLMKKTLIRSSQQSFVLRAIFFFLFSFLKP